MTADISAKASVFCSLRRQAEAKSCTDALAICPETHTHVGRRADVLGLSRGTPRVSATASENCGENGKWLAFWVGALSSSNRFPSLSPQLISHPVWSPTFLLRLLDVATSGEASEPPAAPSDVCTYKQAPRCARVKRWRKRAAGLPVSAALFITAALLIFLLEIKGRNKVASAYAVALFSR